MKTTGVIIKELRESRGLTQQQLADIVGAKTYTTISKWESDENFPRGKEIVKLSEFFKKSSDYILGLEDDSLNIDNTHYYPFFPVAVSAGLPIEVKPITEEDVDFVSVPDVIMGKWAGNHGVYIMHVNGESMNNMMPHNSMIAVKQIELDNLKDGDIVVYSDNGDYSVKRFYNDKIGNRLIFRPDSNDNSFTDYIIPYADAANVCIHGKVVVYVVNMD